jgi:hypothetical protein
MDLTRFLFYINSIFHLMTYLKEECLVLIWSKIQWTITNTIIVIVKLCK